MLDKNDLYPRSFIFTASRDFFKTKENRDFILFVISKVYKNNDGNV